MSKIISQIAREIATRNRPCRGPNKSKLIVSLHGNSSEIKEQLLSLPDYPYDLLEICPLSPDLFPLKLNIKKPWILTYKKRPLSTIEEYISDLEKLMLLQPDYIDVDCEDFDEVSEMLHFNGKWIISYHDEAETPHSLTSLNLLYEKLSSRNASLVKIAITPVSPAHALSILSRARQIQEKEQKLMLVCMGKRYSWTRVLSSKWNIGATYCSLKGYERFGQLSLEELIETYSFFKHNESTELFALLGDPIEHSISHITHNQIFHEMDLHALYCKIPMRREEISSFLEVAKFHFSGFSITMPLKNAIVPREIVNTVLVEHFNYSYANTDAPSAVSLLEEKKIPFHKYIAILGTGSTAQAIGSGLVKAGWKNLHFLTRNPQLSKINGISAISYDSWTSPKELTVVINATPLSASFSEELSSEIFKSCVLFFEVNYNPSKTHLVQMALEKKCEIIWGIELFARQAALQIALWFHLGTKEKEAIESRILSISSSQLSLDTAFIQKRQDEPLLR